MKNRKTNIGRKNPTSAEISNRKNFAELETQLSAGASGAGAASLFKSSWVAIGAAVITVAVIVGAVFFKGKKKKQQAAVQQETTLGKLPNSQPEATAPFINPLSSEADVPFETYTLQAEKGGVLEHPSGTKINVPADAFTDKEGNVVEGGVVIHYREFHNQLDILKAGIPMEYDSAGSTHLESAGMMEIRAYKDGKPLFSNPDVKIDVSLTSYKTDGNYNVYFLDEEQEEWAYKGKDKKKTPKERYEKLENTNDNNATSAASSGVDYADYELGELKGIAVKNVNFKSKLWESRNEKGLPILGETYYFTLEDIIPHHPEMAVFDSITWKYERKLQRGNMGTKFFEDCLGFITKPGEHLYRYWEVVLVTFEPGNDYLTFTFRREGKPDSQASLRPIFDEGKEPKTCGELYMQYKAMTERKKQSRAEQLKNLKKRYGKTVDDRFYVIRNFSIDGLGIWNCDKPINTIDIFNPCATKVVYPGQEQDSVNIKYTYFIEKSINTVLPVVRGNGYHKPGGEGYLVTLFYDGRMGYCNINKKANLRPDVNKMTCPLTITEDVIIGIDKLRKEMGTDFQQLPS